MTAAWSQWPRRHRHAIDVIIAVLLCAMATYASRVAGGLDGYGPMVVRPASPAVFALSALASLALLWRRRFPRGVLLLTTGCAMTIGVLGFEMSVVSAGAAFVAMYSIEMYWSRTCHAKAAQVAAGLALLITSLITSFTPLLTGDRITLIAGLLVASAFGAAGRNRRDYLAALHARAELAERTREEEARLRVSAERLRIARELHDVVAHHMALAHAQASTAAYLLRIQPDQVQEMLDQLSGTTSAALRELKASVGLLRESEVDVPLAPAPGLAQLGELLASFERTGLTPSLSISGVPRPLSPGTDLTAYRIIQEALTNVTKHAGAGASATVHLVYSRLLLTISVSDDGGRDARPPAPDGQSFGLIGMNERAISVGGNLHAGHRPDGGFEVTTELPLAHSENLDLEDKTA
ncbi:sensor histidine kinase [Nocardia brasiliensis]|uniref:sensor histidine kinase n=1 Tax=Nocardia brasiliensis TaxID=37326 RepID=UPI002458294E|nr:sensor histidine kinase [Nocardia brasiliensis]